MARGTIAAAADAAVLIAALWWLTAPGFPSLLVLALLGVGAVLAGRPTRERVVLVLTLGGALAVLSVDHWQQRRVDPRERMEQAWHQLLDDLEITAADAAARFPIPVDDGRESRIEAFSELADRWLHRRRKGFSFVLVDRDGEARAWAGAGLLHEPRPSEIPAAGLVGWNGWSASTVVAVVAIDDHRRPWRVVVGRSLSNESFRVADLEGVRWRIGTAPDSGGGATSELEGLDLIDGGEGRLSLVADLRRARLSRGIGSWVLVLPLAALLAIWARRWKASPSAFAVVGSAATLAIAGVSLGAGTVAATALFGAALALVAARELAARGWPQRGGAWGTAVGASVLVAGLAWAHRRGYATDLLGSAGGSLGDAVWLLSATFAALAVLLLTPQQPDVRVSSGTRLAVAGVLILAASLCISWPWLAGALVVLGAVALARWRVHGAGLLGVLLVVLGATWIAAVSWETGRRYALEQRAPLLADKLESPTRSELDDLAARLNQQLGGLDLASVSPFAGDPDLIDEDLAAALWRFSLLADLPGLSAISLTSSLDPETLTFAVGLPLTAEGELDLDPQRWRDLGIPGREELLIEGQGDVTLQGQAWGSVRWWVLPAPDVVAPGPGSGRLPGTVLLREAASAGGWMPRLAAPFEVALVDGDGHTVAAPWSEVPAVMVDREVVTTPAGNARVFVRPWLAGARIVLFLLRPDPFGALERVVAVALAGLLVLVPPALVVAIGMSLPRRLLTVARDSWRSYPRRLAIVYGALLLVPLVVLHLVFAQVLAERLRAEQRAAGETALKAAERVLGEYVANLPPGFGIATEIDDSFLVWLSRVVQHELNLYWGSQLVASSKRELVDAGLLPERIPGDVYLRLALRGEELAARTNRTAGARYLELYAPVSILGQPLVSSRLFVSMPLLDVEQSIERQIGELRRQSLVVIVLLFLALLALGLRLSRGFTRPIAQIVEGTRRIASGASTLGVTPPEERELAELTIAVDEMARGLAEGRERLVRGKQVVDRMIEHITAGVVSLDRQGQVVLLNRAAARLLGATPGASLRSLLREDPRLEELACFFDDARGGPLLERTVKIAATTGEREWRAVWVPLPTGAPSGALDDPTGLLVVEDATESLRAERLGAWAEMARIIAHEIKNPLTPIRLSAEHLREVWRRDPDRVGAVLERCVNNILGQVEELRLISTEFSTYAHIPRLSKQPDDLRAVAAELVEAYSGGGAAASVVLVAPAGPVAVELDRRLLGRALRNLVENALRASGGRGAVEVVVEEGPSEVILAVRDRGPGVPEGQLGRIFDPYFSTHDTGTGLGLPITRRIIEEHGGEIRATNRNGGGLEVTCTIPRR